jgi:superfamily II DNA or RNA helicase
MEELLNLEPPLSNREQIQKNSLDAIGEKRRASIAVSMGVGKTLIGLRHMLNEYERGKRKFLVVAPNLPIFDSWKADAIKFGMSHLLDSITFSTYRSIAKQERDYDVVYLDECHSLLPTHEYFLETYGGKILGLTGTPPRHKTSEKGILVDKFCPIVYKYITDDAVDDDILNDYRIIIHKVPLSKYRTLKVPKRSGGFFMNSEQSSYEYWSAQIESAVTQKQKMMARIMRMKAMMGFDSKTKYANYLLSMIDEKCIVFCNTTEQADEICSTSYHSKNNKEVNEANIAKFSSGEAECLSCVQQLNQGINIPNLKNGIIMHAYSNERQSSQRIGRLLRLSPNETSIIHILVYENTVDEDWVYEALKELDNSKISYYE